MPGLSRVGVLLDAGDIYASLMMREIERVARTMGVRLQNVEARSPADFERAFEAAILDRVDALIAVEGVLTLADLTRIVDFAGQQLREIFTNLLADACGTLGSHLQF